MMPRPAPRLRRVLLFITVLFLTQAHADAGSARTDGG
jgi:hypothetical protein